MKVKSLILLSVLVAVFAFGKTRKQKQFIRIAANSIDGVYKFTGNLNGKIPVFVWFVVKDSVVKGEVTYQKTAKRIPIPVIGEITKDNGFELFEFEKNGNITGIYRGPFNNKLLKGLWFAPASGKELSYTLTPKDTTLTSADVDLRAIAIAGKYSYAYGKTGGTGEINIKRLSGDTYAFDAGCVTSAPAYNLANVDSTVVKIAYNAVIYKVPDTDCRFKLRFFKSFLIIDQLKPLAGDCGFGNNASIHGVFIKTGNVARLEVLK